MKAIKELFLAVAVLFFSGTLSAVERYSTYRDDLGVKHRVYTWFKDENFNPLCSDISITLNVLETIANNYNLKWVIRDMTVTGTRGTSNVATDEAKSMYMFSDNVTLQVCFESNNYWFYLVPQNYDDVWGWPVKITTTYYCQTASSNCDRHHYKVGTTALSASHAPTCYIYRVPLGITMDTEASKYVTVRQVSDVSETMAARNVNVYVNGKKVGNQVGTYMFPSKLAISRNDLVVAKKEGINYVFDSSKGDGTGITAGGTDYNIYLVQQYKVEGSIDHGTKTNSPQTVNHGSSNTAMVFTPATNYVISGVTVNGSAVSGWTSTSYTYPAQTIIENKSVVVSTANKYVVSYNGNGATTGTVGNQDFVYGTAQNLRANGFARTLTVSFDGQGGTPASSSLSSSSSFNGWEDRGRIIYGGTTYAYTQFDAPYYSNGYSDLYAAFGYNKYSLISHYINNGKGEGRSPKGSTPGLYPAAALVNNLSTEAGYTVPLYANWTDNAITLPSATKDHYKLDGWYTSASGGTRVGGAGDSYVPTSTSVTLYARWTLADANVVITRSGLAEGESAIYTVTDGTRTYTVILTGPDASATLANLPIGTYTVAENGWSWNSQIPAPQSADITGGHTFSFTASKKSDQPLNAEGSKKNW